MAKYNHQDVERRWQERWEKEGFGRARDLTPSPSPQIRRGVSEGRGEAGEKSYVLVEFPYPSGDGLHVGHVRSYTALDAVARKARMEGKNVLFPIGWDAFGLPTENYALKTGVHPREATDKNIANFRRQMKSLGLSFDWSRQVDTTDPAYYKWTQWIFLKLLNAGLAYQATIPISWCPKDKIGLANEEVVAGKCERCGTIVERRMQKQWMLKITAYADRLLKDLDTVDYSERIKAQQQHWIGKSEGAEVTFAIEMPDPPDQVRGRHDSGTKNVTVFTTRPDTLFGATYLVLSPEHPLVDVITDAKQKKAVEKYRKQVASKSDLERTSLEKEKTGVFTGAHAVNPVNNEKIPVWIADYVLMSYGTGAIMAVPAHDERDHEFAKKFKLPIRKVIKPPSLVPQPFYEARSASPGAYGHLGSDIESVCWTGEGTMVNSGKFDGLTSEEGRKKIVEWLANEAIDDKPTCLVVHGISGHKRENWFPWFKKELDAIGWNTIIPTMPGAGHPTAKSWDDYLSQFDSSLDDRSVLVGHSLGCSSVLRHLQTMNQKVDTVILVAPTNPQQHWDVLKRERPNADWDAVERMNREKDLDWNKIRKLSKRFVIIYSDNDPFIPEESIAFFKKHLSDAEFHLMPGKSHFGEQWGITELPEILSFIPVIQKLGSRARFAVNYKLRDWVFSRQHYWGEPIPVVHCEACRKKAESTKWELKFFDTEGAWEAMRSGRKIVETRALNPEDTDRWHYGDVKVGDILKDVLVGTDETMYFRVTGRKIVKKLNDLFGHPDLLRGIAGGRDLPKTLQDLEKFYAFTPDYLDRIRKHGLICWTVEHVIPGVVPVPEDQLPVVLPSVERYEPTGTGESPLAAITDWVNTKCPKCGGPAKRETDTMPNWAGSSWYFLRYCDPKNEKVFAGKKQLEYWMPVDLYNGGMEHTTLHLLYSRFWHKFLFDQGFVPTAEPYQKRVSHGMVLAKDGRKMSKSFGNVVNPDDLVKQYGADSVRLYEMFMGPFEDAIPWDTKGIVGMQRFLQRIWDAKEKVVADSEVQLNKMMHSVPHLFVRHIGTGLDEFRFNTCVSDLMKFANSWVSWKKIPKSHFEIFVKLLSPFAPHLAEELWSQLGHTTLVSKESWPKYDEEMTKAVEAKIAVQVNGKLRGTISMPNGSEQELVVSKAKELENVKKFVVGTPKKIIFVKDRLINFVV